MTQSHGMSFTVNLWNGRHTPLALDPEHISGPGGNPPQAPGASPREGLPGGEIELRFKIEFRYSPLEKPVPDLIR